MSESETERTQQTVEPHTRLVTTKLGRACVSGNIDLRWAATLYKDLELARPCLAVDTSLHLLYLVTPYDLAHTDRQVYSANNYHRYRPINVKLFHCQPIILQYLREVI